MSMVADLERYKASLTEEGRSRLLVDAVTDYAIYMLDPLGFVTSWNSGARRLVGYQASEVIGEHFSIFYTANDRQDGLPALALNISAHEGMFEGDGWRLRKDGSRFWAHVVIDPVRDGAGELVGSAKVIRDRSEQHLFEGDLRRSEDQFRLLVQSVTDYAIFLLDRDGRVTTWNLGAQRIKGYPPCDIIGRHFSIFYIEEDIANGEPERALATAVEVGRFEKEGWRVRQDGSRFWASVVIDLVRGVDHQVIGFAKVTRDSTASRAAHLAIRRAQDALMQSQKTEAVERLTRGVAHDFNNILAAVLGGLEVVIGRLPEDPHVSPLLINAHVAAQRGAVLTQRMLAFVRGQDLKPQLVDVQALAQGMMGVLQQTLGPKIAIKVDFPRSLGMVYVDANQLELAILNLAINARDAISGHGWVKLTGLMRNLDPEPPSLSGVMRFVCLSLMDSGKGMDEDTLSRATDPFFSTKEVGCGAGLGLSMVQGFAEQSGGKLVLESRMGEGTYAELWLPAAANSVGQDLLWANQYQF
jgi:PAS domain S-box-containing protein